MKPLESSFRDDAGFLVEKGGQLLRVVTPHGREGYDLLLQSGLYERLQQKQWLISHREEKNFLADFPGAYQILIPERIPFISYPYEWCFSQLKDAALLTLDIQKEALARGLSLKDASFFNVQFMGGRPVFIDTLSFEKRLDQPWVAYGQFCQHFVAPLALMSYGPFDFNRTLISFLDGIPLDTACRLLPWRAFLRPGIFMHVWLHALGQRRSGSRTAPTSTMSFVSCIMVS